MYKFHLVLTCYQHIAGCVVLCVWSSKFYNAALCSVASLLLGRGNSPTSRPGTCPRILFKGVDSGADAAIFAHFLLSSRDAPFKASPSHSNEICSQSTNRTCISRNFKQGEVWSNQDCVSSAFASVIFVWSNWLSRAPKASLRFTLRAILSHFTFEAILYNVMSHFTPLFSCSDQIFVLQHFSNWRLPPLIINLSLTHIMPAIQLSLALKGDKSAKKHKKSWKFPGFYLQGFWINMAWNSKTVILEWYFQAQ